jgi:hypothetical protein
MRSGCNNQVTALVAVQFEVYCSLHKENPKRCNNVSKFYYSILKTYEKPEAASAVLGS